MIREWVFPGRGFDCPFRMGGGWSLGQTCKAWGQESDLKEAASREVTSQQEAHRGFGTLFLGIYSLIYSLKVTEESERGI